MLTKSPPVDPFSQLPVTVSDEGITGASLVEYAILNNIVPENVPMVNWGFVALVTAMLNVPHAITVGATPLDWPAAWVMTQLPLTGVYACATKRPALLKSIIMSGSPIVAEIFLIRIV